MPEVLNTYHAGNTMTEETTNGEMIPLTSKQKKFLKALAHPLTPLVQIGKEGITDGVIEATNHELLQKELIKVKIGTNSSAQKGSAGEELSLATQSHLVQIIGKTLVLFRENPKRKKEERIRLPKA